MSVWICSVFKVVATAADTEAAPLLTAGWPPCLHSFQASLAPAHRLSSSSACRMIPNYGGFGKGEMKWYALWVLTMKEEELGYDLEALISRLGQVENAEGKLIPRDVDSWVPKKMNLKWNNRHALELSPCL